MKYTGEQLVFDPQARLKTDALFWEHIMRYIHTSQFLSATEHSGPPLRKVLDAACGTGYGTYLMSHRGYDCTGVDLSNEAIGFARRLYQRPSCQFAMASVDQLPHPDASFDAVVSFETIEHLDSHTQVKFLDEVKRVLKPGGMLVISSPVKAIYNRLDHPDGHPNPFHLHELDLAEFESLIEDRFRVSGRFGQTIVPSENITIEQLPRQPLLIDKIRARLSLWLRPHLLDHSWLLEGLAALYAEFSVRPLPEGTLCKYAILHAVSGQPSN